TFAAKDLGAKLSLKMIQEKYGKPSKTAEYRTKLGEKILTLKEYHYPPIFFVAEKDSDDVFLISAPNRLWSRAGLLDNARGLPADEKKDGQSPGKLDGKWHVVRQEEHGNLVPAIVSKRLSMVIDGDKMEWYIGNPAPNFAATITIDEEKKTIDAKITRGSFIGKKMLGIYKFEKDQLHMCWGEIGTDTRPEKNVTTKRSEE